MSIEASPAEAPAAAPMRRILLVTPRSSALLAVQRATRLSRATRLRFFADVYGASEALAHWRPDALIIDIAATGRAGVALCERLRARYPDVPLAVLADRVGTAMAEAVRRTGADGSLIADMPDLLGHLARLRSAREETAVRAA